MELYGRKKSILECEYFGEVGTGLGPTLEFYSLVCKRLQSRSLSLWRQSTNTMSSTTTTSSSTTSNENDLIQSDFGLYPSLINPASSVVKTDQEKKNIEMFEFIGIFVAKAILDGRVLDLSFSTPFLKMMLGQSLSFEDLKEIDRSFASSFEKLVSIALKVQNGELDDFEEKKMSELIDSLELDFSLPGKTNWKLETDDPNITLETSVTLENLPLYVKTVIRTLLYDGISLQFQRFEKGFNSVFPLQNLRLLTVEELECIISGSPQATKWNLESKCVVCVVCECVSV